MRTNQHSWMLRATCCCRLAQEPSAYTSVLSSDVIHVDKVIVRAHSQVAERQTLSNQIEQSAAAVAGLCLSFPHCTVCLKETHRPSGEYLRSEISSFACRICRYPYRSHGAASVASTYVRLQHCMTPRQSTAAKVSRAQTCTPRVCKISASEASHDRTGESTCEQTCAVQLCATYPLAVRAVLNRKHANLHRTAPHRSVRHDQICFQ
jgi:hypothetical protein